MDHHTHCDHPHRPSATPNSPSHCRVIAANLGDSRAVLCHKGLAVALSVDHKPNRDDERKRIEEAGGWINEHKELNLSVLYRLDPKLVTYMEIPRRIAEVVGFVNVCRVCGELAVTRSFGDAEYKGAYKKEYWGKEFKEDLVSAVPEVITEAMDKTSEFVVLASDGLWDVMTNQEAVDFVKLAIKNRQQPAAAVRSLVCDHHHHLDYHHHTLPNRHHCYYHSHHHQDQ